MAILAVSWTFGLTAIPITQEPWLPRPRLE